MLKSDSVCSDVRTRPHYEVLASMSTTFGGHIVLKVTLVLIGSFVGNNITVVIRSPFRNRHFLGKYEVTGLKGTCLSQVHYTLRSSR